jgi:hypothetical protein
MQMIAPDIVADVRGLSPALQVTGLVVGLSLWLMGWRNHRFWVVLVITVTAGVYGLAQATALHTSPLVAALLLAVAAGVLALSLIRLIAFAAGGLFSVIAMQALAPHWDQPIIPFILGGLLGHFLFRFWTMLLTSLCGTLLMTYTIVGLADRMHKLDAVAWTEKRTNLLNWVCGAVAVVGLVTQVILERKFPSKADSKKDKVNGAKAAEKKEKPSDKPPSLPFPLNWAAALFRKAA